jgi:hypothetical protein
MQDSVQAAFQEFITRVEPAHSAFQKTLTGGLAVSLRDIGDTHAAWS